MGVSDVAEQQKGAEMSLLLSQIHLAPLSLKLEINTLKLGEDYVATGTEL